VKDGAAREGRGKAKVYRWRKEGEEKRKEAKMVISDFQLSSDAAAELWLLNQHLKPSFSFSFSSFKEGFEHV